MANVQKNAEELRADFEAARLMLPREDLRDLGKKMLERGGLPGFQLALNPELEELQSILNDLMNAEQRETAPRKRA